MMDKMCAGRAKWENPIFSVKKKLVQKWNRSGHDIAHPARPVDAPGDNKFNVKEKQKQKGTMQ